METVARSGRQFRVQFVHSAHDINHRLGGEPGGLRQFVDNLALSLHRRVTLCEISLVEEAPALTTDTEPQKVITALGQGFALCHHKDQFIKRVGRAYALKRGLHNISDTFDLYEDEAEDICLACGTSWAEIQWI